MRLVSWNVRDLTGDPGALHGVLRDLTPDVVCLQEAPRRPGGGLRLALLGRGTGLVPVCGGRGSGGTAILARPGVRVERAAAFRLPVSPWYRRTRGLAVARLELDDTRVVAVSVHLPLTAPEREHHARLVRAALHGQEQHAVLAGDLNEPPDGPAWQVLRPLGADPGRSAPLTFPARDPQHRLDVVLVGAGLTVTGYGDGGVDPARARRASDHLPVVVDLVSRERR